MSLYLWYIDIVSKYIFEFKTLNVILKFSNIKAISKNVYQYIEKKNGKSYYEQTALHANNLQNPFFFTNRLTKLK